MKIYEDVIAGYTDGNGLVTASPCSGPNRPGQGSDNGPMYSSEALIMAKKLGVFDGDKDAIFLLLCIRACIDRNGLLHRVPVPTPAGQSNRQEGPDDYLAVLNLCKHIEHTEIPRQFLGAVLEYFGFLNNESPGYFSKSSFLIRQPQLLAAMTSAAFPSLHNPAHWAVRIIAFPFFLIAAIVIATSCIGVEKGDTDSRRLSWHLLQTTKPVSLLCYLASKLWYKRLYRDYGPTGMKAVASIYYYPQGSHPFAKYWVTE